MELTREIQIALSQPFPEEALKFIPKAPTNGKALALAFVSSRAVMQRLDEVVEGNWAFDFEPLTADGKMVRGRLMVCGVTRCDAGEANKEDEPLKSAVSDALKRCGVLFGIGRYLYHLPQVWCAFDAQKRQFTEKPQISPAAMNRALALCGVETAPIGRMRPPARPESRGDQAAAAQPEPAADHSGAGQGEADALKAEIQTLFMELHPSLDFFKWAEGVFGKAMGQVRTWDHGEKLKAVRNLRTEKAAREGQARQGGTPPPDTSALRQGL